MAAEWGLAFWLSVCVVAEENAPQTALRDASQISAKMDEARNGKYEAIPRLTSTVKVDIDDMVDNQMNQMIDTSQLPWSNHTL
jgi:hypothetical protein